MNLKYCLITSLAATLVASATGAYAQDIRVTVNGERVRFRGQPPIEVDDRVLVPLRGVFEDLGAQVNWNPENQTVTARRGDTQVRLTIGERTASVDGDPVQLDVPAQIIDDSTMVPLRFVGEALGDRVHWNEDSQTVSIIGGGDYEFTRDHHDEGDYGTHRGWRRNEGDGRSDDPSAPPPEPPYRTRIIEDDVPPPPAIVYDTDTVIPADVDLNIDLSNFRPGQRISTVVPTYPGLPPDCRISGVVREVGPYYRGRPPLVDLQFDTIETPGGHRYHIDGRAVPFNSTTVIRGRDGSFRATGRGAGFVRIDHNQRFGIRLNQSIRIDREAPRSAPRRSRSTDL